jgi:dTDP-4-amino-4,6-dideoxygalactose transaminase
VTLRIPPARIFFPDEDRRDILRLIDEALVTGRLTLGKHVRAFEEEFARASGTRYAVAVNSGTSSLEIPLRVFGVSGK